MVSSISSQLCPRGHEYPVGQPYCANIECLTRKIEKIEKRDDGSIWIYVEGYKYPAQGAPEERRLGLTAATKRTFIATPRLIFGLLTAFTVKRALNAVRIWVEDIYIAEYQKHKIPVEEMSISAREIYRVLVKRYGIQPWIECGVMIYDTDWAYKFRVQDILGELCQRNISKPLAEIGRLFNLVRERELNDRVKWKWAMVERWLKISLFISPFLRREVLKFLAELDIEKIKMNVNDKYWVCHLFDYNYCGMTYEERMAWRREEDKDLPPEKPVEPEKPRITINTPNKEFYALSRADAEQMAEQTKQTLLKHYDQVRNSASIH